MEWKQKHVLEIPLGSREDGTKKNADEDVRMDEEVAGGVRENATSLNIIDVQKSPNTEALVLLTRMPTNASATLQVASTGNEGEKTVIVTRAPLEGLVISLNNATETEGTNKSAVVQVMAATGSTVSLPTQNTERLANVTNTTTGSTVNSPNQVTKPVMNVVNMTTESIVKVSTQTEKPLANVANTTKPSLRAKGAAIILENVTDDDANTQVPGYLNQSNNPLVWVVLASICCIFLFVWGRKRRSSATASSGTFDGTISKGLKVQYTQVPGEQPLTRSQDEDNECCGDYEEDTFTNDRDNWDDWEDESAQAQLNPFAAAPSIPSRTTLRHSSPSPYKLTQPLPPPPQQQIQGGVNTIKGDVLLSSVESNSSSDSFEVVTDVANAMPTSSYSAAADAEKESDSVDDLFCQFGMVLPFKKSAVVPPSPVVTTAAAPVSQPATRAPATAAAPSISSLPTAAEASALFAAEMDDELTAVVAADEWGEDDEWEKGL